jgi:hypothetical protein
MVNDIPQRQNDAANLKLLRAQRQMYAQAKLLLILQVVVTVILPVSAAIAVIFVPSIKALTAACGFVAVLLDAIVLDRLQKNTKKVAAKIQEMFDCNVLRLEWDDFSVGARPEPETMHDAIAASEKTSKADLKNWYPVVVGDVEEHLARIVCQRTNLVYDAELRRRFGNWTLILGIAISAILFVVGVALQLPMDRLMLTVVVPIVPVLVWGIREYYRQKDAADASDRLRQQVRTLWDKAVTSRYSESECTVRSRLLQNAIHDRRASAPLLLDSVYRRLRPNLESKMDFSAEELVMQVKSRTVVRQG